MGYMRSRTEETHEIYSKIHNLYFLFTKKVHTLAAEKQQAYEKLHMRSVNAYGVYA
jgi:hypothetical protein